MLPWAANHRDRYDDRMNIRVNLIEAYDLLMDFVAKHLSDPFYLDGIQRVSLRDKIFREIVANLLVHREYTDARPANLIICGDRAETTNAAHPHGQGHRAGALHSVFQEPDAFQVLHADGSW